MSRILSYLWGIIALTAIAGCSTFEGETTATKHPTTIHCTADIEEQLSRAYFDENDSNGYSALWSGGEHITVVALDSNLNSVATTTSTMQIDAERGTASFDATFDDLPATTAYLRAYANRDADLAEQYMESDGDVVMRLTSNDTEYVANKALRMSFAHDTAYGRMTLNLPTGIAASDIVKLNITIDDKEYVVRINNSALESPVVWFSAEEDEQIEYMRVAFTTTTAKCYERVINDMQSKNEPLELSRSYISRFKVGTFVECEAESIELDSASIRDAETPWTGYSYLTFEDDVLGYISFMPFISVGDFTYYDELTLGFGYNPNEIYNNSGRDTANTYWRPQGSTTQYAITDGEVQIVATSDNQYDITFTITTNGIELTAHYHGVITGVDLRTYLSWPENLRTTVSGKTVTIEWDAVTNAVGYVALCSTEGVDVEQVETTECSATFEMPEYSMTYEFKVKAVADINNGLYKDSGYNICTATTDVDPFAEYVMTTVAWDSTNSYFLFSNERGDYLRVYLNQSDRPNNNSIMAGTYDYAGYKGNPDAGTFGLNRTWFTSAIAAAKYDTTQSTMTVSIVDGKYRILWSLYHTEYNKTYTAGFAGLGSLVLPPAASPTLEVSSTSLAFEAAGGTEEVTITLENSDAAIELSCDNAHFGYTLSGTTLSITAPENSTTAVVEGTITVTAGTLSRSITLTQAAAESGVNEGGGNEGGEEDTWGGVATTMTLVDGSCTSSSPGIFQCSGGYSGYIKLGMRSIANGTFSLTDTSTIPTACWGSSPFWGMTNFTDGTIEINGNSFTLRATVNGTKITATGTFA